MGKSLVLKVLDKQNKLNKISLLAFAFFVLLLSSHISAQVIIKEKVEINPQNNIIPDYPQSNFDPCLNINRPPYYQSVYSCSGYQVEPYQQMFPWQSSSYLGQFDSATVYNVEIISGTDYAYFYKVGYWDTLSNVQVDPEYIGSSLTGLTGVELAGWGEYRVYQGIGVWEREHFALYNIRFDNFDLQTAYVTVRIKNTSTNEVTDWHTTIVNPQYTMQNSGIDGDTVLHNRSIIITPNISNSLALTCNQFGYGSCPPTNVTFNIEIVQGQEYGNIGKYDSYWGMYEYAPAFTGLSFDQFAYESYVFNANGLQPDSTAVVRIRQSSSDTDIGSFEYTLNIKRNFLPPVSENGSIVIETNKNTAMPGDTLDILLKWEDGSNGIVDFSDWQEFGVWLADGFSYGTLFDPVTGDTSDAFEVTGKELKLIVHQGVTDANKKIVIAAETEVAILGGNRMMQNNPQPKTETKSTDKKIISNFRTVEQGGFVKANNKIDKSDAVDKDDDDGETNIDIIIGSQYLSRIKEIVVNPFIVEIDPPTVSAGDTARIIPKYMDENGNYVKYDSTQTFELGMLDGCVLGTLSNAGIDTNYFYGVTQPFYFIADSSADSGTVNIRVGVIDMNQQNRSITNNNNIIPESDNPVSCANVSFAENLYANGIVVVEDNWCDDLDECDEIEFPHIELEVFENNWQNLDVCVDPDFLAGTAFLTSDNSNYREDFDIELCKEEGSDKIQFTFDDDLIINCVSDMCEDNISARQDILIDDVYSFPSNVSCYGKIVFLEMHTEYPMKTRIKIGTEIIEEVYVVRYIWERHEEVHRDHFLEVAEGFKAEYLIKIKETIKQCSEFSSEEDALSEFKQAAEKIIKQFYDATYNKDLKISNGGGNKEKELEFENNTIHKKVIDNYLQPLIDYWKLSDCGKRF